jgi:hypothetical protein
MGVEAPPHYGKCLHTAPTREHPHGRLRRASEYNSDFVRKKQKEARMRSGWTSDRVGYLEKDTRYALAHMPRLDPGLTVFTDLIREPIEQVHEVFAHRRYF